MARRGGTAEADCSSVRRTAVLRNRFFKYDGDWRLGRRHGRGTLHFADGGYILGTWVDGELTEWLFEATPAASSTVGATAVGLGFRKWPNGDTYSGAFVMGERHGEGVMVYADGSRFEGSFILNQREGPNCTLTFPNGDEYVGDFRSNKIHGDGAMTYTDGRRYEGQWVRGKYHGRGRLRQLDGTVIEAIFANDIMAVNLSTKD